MNLQNLRIPIVYLFAILASTVVVALPFFDHKLAEKAHARILERNADFNFESTVSNIDWSQTGIQGCKVGKEFMIYKYQACFWTTVSAKSNSDSFSIFYYSKPRPFFSFSRLLVSSDAYFSELAYARKMFEIFQSGKIVEVK
ncbi:MAG: hypothetical protein ABJM43_22130 [Paracoccaceae bacterium]|uniref:hypothetical protein n=1 Tax=Ascidiaceihabitans sp. TaxID=1872644 RepID=UPI0032967FE9